MKRIMMRGTLLLCGVLLMSGCRKDLCYIHDRHAPRVQVTAATRVGVRVGV